MKDTIIRGSVMVWDDDRSPVVLAPPTKTADEAAPLIDLVERNRCSGCGIVAHRKQDGQFRPCLTPACAKKRAEAKRLSDMDARSGERHSIRRGNM